MVNLTDDDVNMGKAGENTFGEARHVLPKIDGHWVLAFSADRAIAFGELPDAKGFEIAYWSLTPEQVELLLAKAPERRLASEVGERPTVHLTHGLESQGMTACGRRDVPAAERTADADTVTCEVCAEVAGT
jgi:hypothetical protein